jgi:cytoskeleton protein RodZ
MGQLTDLSTKGNGLAMGLFGDRLRREREMRGITLDEITESTKISRRHLEALEGEHFDQLPGGVFNKGFVRAYARFLGIDEDQAVADYSAASNEQPEPENKFPLEIHEEPNRELNPRRSKLPLVFAVAALVGVLVGYFFFLKSKSHGPEATQPGGAQASSAPAPEPVTVKPPTQVRATPVTADHTPVAPAPVKPAKQTQPAVEAAAAPPAKKPAEKTFVVLIKAKEDAWVSIVADGKSVMQKVLIADRKKLVKAGKQIVLRTGNAGGIDVSFNGKSLGAIGNENEPRTLTFNTTGLVQ